MPNLTDIKIPITGSKALTPSETQIQGVGATPVLPYSMPEPEHARGAKLSAIRKFNISEYENILGRGQVNPNLDLSVLNENRAQNQSGWYLTKNAIGQLGTTILGGTITGIGSILNFFPTTYRAISQIWDDNAKYKWDKAINEGLDLPMDEAIVVEENLFGSCFKTHDQIEGMDAFLTKRKEKNFINA